MHFSLITQVSYFQEAGMPTIVVREHIALFFYFHSTKYDKIVVTVSVMIVSEILHFIIGGTT